MIQNLLNSILNFFQELAQNLLKILPTSPFDSFINSLNGIPYMEYINFFLPLDIIIPILTAWGTAIGLYYAYMIILRWVKAIE